MDPRTSPQPDFVRQIDLLVRARYPLVYLVSWEEQRVEDFVFGLARSQSKDFYTWSVTRGLRRMSGSRTAAAIEGTGAPRAAFAAIAAIQEPAIVLVKDLHPHLTDPEAVRALRELGHMLKSKYVTVLLLSPVFVIPTELEKEITVVDVPLPTSAELRELLRGITDLVGQSTRARVLLSDADADDLVKAAQGLTLAEAENVFARAIVDDGKLDRHDISMVMEEKRQVVRKSGLLEYHPAREGLSQIGGLELLKEWLLRRKSAFGEAARRFGLPEPKGILLLGVQGCGKSLTAKAVAAEWGLPLLRLDVGRIFSSYMGSSEQNLRKAIGVAESVAPVVLWLDEIEKGLSGVSSSGMGDSGVTARVFGNLLTWLQEKTSPVFVVATANRVDLLPPELLRKGRFDEMFFIDLPSEPERADIFRIHLRAKHRDPRLFDLEALARSTMGFSGAEIEQVIVGALFDAFSEGVDLAERHLEGTILATVPLSRTMAEEVSSFRRWAITRARPASVPVLFENVPVEEMDIGGSSAAPEERPA